MPLIREALSAALCGFLLLPTHAAAPAWWIQRGVVDPDQLSDDFAVINQGQLKNLLKAAVSEMDAKLDGGAGTTLNSMVTGWETITGAEDDYAVVNIGQLKTVGKPVHERLLAVGLISSLPVWATTLSASNEDFAAANIGQAKKLLSFDLDLDSDSDGLSDYREIVLGFDPHDEDTDGDGLPDGWEYYHGLDAQIATGNDGADGDPDNDGITNAQALAQNTHPNPIHFWIEHRYVYASIGMTGQLPTLIDCSDYSKIPTESLDSKKPTEIQALFNGIVSGFQSNEGWLGAPDPGYGYFPLGVQTFTAGKSPAYYTFEEHTSLEGSMCLWTQFRLKSNRNPTPLDVVPSIRVMKFDTSSGSDVFTGSDSLTLNSGTVTLNVDWGVITEEDEHENEKIIEHARVGKKAVVVPIQLDIRQPEDGTPLPLARATSTAVNGPSQEDDFAIVSNGTDADLASELSISVPSAPGLGSVTANVRMKGSDGNLTFQSNSVVITPGTPSVMKIWGAAASSGENTSRIEVELAMAGGTTLVEEDLTIIDGVKISFEGTFYSPVDTRDYVRRPHDGTTPYPPGHYTGGGNPNLPDARTAYPGIMAQDTGDFSSKLVFWDGDQGVTKRTWSPQVKVEIKKIESLNPRIELKNDALLSGEVHVKNGRFLEHNQSRGDLIKGPEFEVRLPGESNEVSTIASTFDVEISPIAGGVGISLSRALADLNAALSNPNQNLLASWIRDVYGPPMGIQNMAKTYSDFSLFARKWENPKFTHTKGADFTKSIAARALAAWQQRHGNEKIQVYFELMNFYEWQLTGDVRNGNILTK